MRAWIGAMVAGLSLVVAPGASAQELAGTFDQLRVLVAPGQTVTVIDQAGQKTTGEIVTLSATSLRLAVAGTVRDLGERDVAQIRQRRPDSLANGAKIGFGVGLALGVLGGVALASTGEEGAWGYALVGAALYAGLGTGVGVGVDALIESEQPIFVARQSGGMAARLRPIVGAGRRGVQFVFRF
jgi:hypothetical protein